MKAGVDAKRLEARGVADTAPLADGDATRNRRVDFQVLDPSSNGSSCPVPRP